MMAKQTGNRLKLGVFITLGLILFTVAIYYVGNKQNMFGETIELSSIFRNVNGLQPGNNVRYSGINVGTVSHITILTDTSVQVNMLIDKESSEHIRTDAIATVSSDGLVGNMIVNILPTGHEAAYVTSGDIIRSYSKIDTDEMLSTLNVTNENAALLTADLLKISEGILERKGTVGALLYDSTIARDIKMIMSHLHSSSAYLNRASQRINSITASLDDNQSLLHQLSTTDPLPLKIDETLNNLQEASEQILRFTNGLNTIIADYEKERGTIQTLLLDTALVRDLKQSMQNINEGTDRFNETMEALQHNFLTRKYFRKQEKAAEKARKKQSDSNE